MSRPAKTLMEVLYVATRSTNPKGKPSFRDTGQLYKLVVTWALAMWQLERDELGIEEFVEWADPAQGKKMQSRATTYRQLALFRKAFPGHHDPNCMCRNFRLVERFPEVDGASEVEAVDLEAFFAAAA